MPEVEEKDQPPVLSEKMPPEVKAAIREVIYEYLTENGFRVRRDGFTHAGWPIDPVTGKILKTQHKLVSKNQNS